MAGNDASDPNRLERRQDGGYLTPDRRFEVKRSGNAWFLVDSGATDELGQPLVHGPMPTLRAVREALPEARRAAVRSARRRRS